MVIVYVYIFNKISSYANTGVLKYKTRLYYKRCFSNVPHELLLTLQYPQSIQWNDVQHQTEQLNSDHMEHAGRGEKNVGEKKIKKQKYKSRILLQYLVAILLKSQYLKYSLVI